MRRVALAFALLACNRAPAQDLDLVSPGTRDLTLKVGKDDGT